MLHASGFDRAAVLNGGLRRWVAEGRLVEAGERSYPRATLKLSPRPDAWASKEEVLSAIGNPEVCTLNALPAELHSGTSETHYGRKGRVSGSCNLPFQMLLDEQGAFRNDTELRALFAAVGAFAHKRVICYCGGGVSATANAFALACLGHPSVAVYDGSMLEWARDPSLPMQCGI